MAFIMDKNDLAGSVSSEYVPAAAATYEVGDALYFSSGNLTAATGTNKPEYIALEAKTIAADGNPLYVQRVAPSTVYDTELSVDSSSIARGTKYTLDSTGRKITATTGSGTAEVVDYDGKVAGAHVRVRFN